MEVKPLVGVKLLPKPVSTESSDNYILSPEQLKFYDDNGYLVLKEFIDFASLYSYKQRFHQICKGIIPCGQISVVKEPTLAKKTSNPEEYINKLQELLYDDVFIRYAEQPRMLSVLTQFIGDEITAINSNFINKPPGSSRHPAHQDLFYFPIRPAEKIIGVWTAVDHVNYENGCLFVIPGSHKAKTMYEHGDRKNTLEFYHGVDEDALSPPEKQVHLEMSPGDTVFFSSYLIHGSGPNRSKTYRKAITYHFANSSCHYIEAQSPMQDDIMRKVEGFLKLRGFTVNYIDVFRFKSRQIKGIRSNL